MPNQLLEVGLHTFLASFQQVTGIGWLAIVRYLPSVIFMLTVLAAYVFCRRRGFGWQGALFTALIPTTVGILGPGFLVPVAVGLLFIALSLFVAFDLEGWPSYPVLGMFTLFLLSMHAATAVALVVVLIPYIVLGLKGHLRRSVGVTAALAVPFLGALIGIPAIWERLVVPSVRNVLVPQTTSPAISIPSLIAVYGVLPALLCVAGSYGLARRGGRTNLALALGALAVLLTQMVFYGFGYGSPMMYYRGFQYAMLMMGIVAGAGLAALGGARMPQRVAARLRMLRFYPYSGSVLCLALVAATVWVAVPARQSTPYYHTIDAQDYQAFIWIRGNLDASYRRAILDPWQGSAFTAITGKNVQTWTGQSTGSGQLRVYEFLGDACRDTQFMVKNRVSVVYAVQAVDNTDLIEVRQNVYLLKAGAGEK